MSPPMREKASRNAASSAGLSYILGNAGLIVYSRQVTQPDKKSASRPESPINGSAIWVLGFTVRPGGKEPGWRGGRAPKPGPGPARLAYTVESKLTRAKSTRPCLRMQPGEFVGPQFSFWSGAWLGRLNQPPPARTKAGCFWPPRVAVGLRPRRAPDQNENCCLRGWRIVTAWHRDG